MTTSLNRYTQYNYNEQSVDKKKNKNKQPNAKILDNYTRHKKMRYKKKAVSEMLFISA